MSADVCPATSETLSGLGVSSESVPPSAEPGACTVYVPAGSPVNTYMPPAALVVVATGLLPASSSVTVTPVSAVSHVEHDDRTVVSSVPLLFTSL